MHTRPKLSYVLSRGDASTYTSRTHARTHARERTKSQQYSLSLVVVKDKVPRRVHEVPVEALGGTIQGVVADLHQSTGSGRAAHLDAGLADRLGEGLLALVEVEHPAVVVVEDHHGRHARIVYLRHGARLLVVREHTVGAADADVA